MTETTKAAVLFSTAEPLRIIDLELPGLKPGQVLVEITYSGLCHSQLNEARGLKGEDKFLPHTLGHEGAGKVLGVGQGVTKVKPGDRVVLTWIKGSGADVPSTTYKSSAGQVNSGAISTFMRKTVTCESRLVPVPEAMPLREAALLGCAVPTGAGIVLNTAKLREGETIAVFGVGGIGLSAILAASMKKAKMIIAVDVFDHKLELAKEVGATHVINAKRENALDVLMKLTEGKGVDYSIESAGRKETMETAFKAVRNSGGLCIIAGNLPQGEKISIDPMDLIRGKRIIGTWGGESQPDKDIAIYADYYLSGRLKLDTLITHTYKLEEINRALQDLGAGKIGRALIEMQP
jgi:S-(hydroxymethyl)glutathione dehydrogenase/alcohol dehydrogenase